MNHLPKRVKRLEVAAFGEMSGFLEKPSQHQFTYAFNNSISLTMPTQKETYNYGALHPVFAQNMPESNIKSLVTNRILQLSKDIVFSEMYMMALLSYNSIGHLSFTSEIPNVKSEPIGLNEILNHKGKDSVFAHLLDSYCFNGMVSGVQPKVLVPVFAKSRQNVESHEYIIKSYEDDFPLLSVNEFVCMQAAKHCGLMPPEFHLSEDLSTYAIKRFDFTPNGKLGVEDFTVLTKVKNTPEAKYQSSYESILTETQRYTNNNIQAIRKVYQYIVFNCLIGNGDAHLKNFSLTYDKNMLDVNVSPPYDITHTNIYGLSDELALKMNNSRFWPTLEVLKNLGIDYGVVKPERVIDELASGIYESINNSQEVNLMPGLKQSILRSIGIAKKGIYTSTGYLHKKTKKFE